MASAISRSFTVSETGCDRIAHANGEIKQVKRWLAVISAVALPVAAAAADSLQTVASARQSTAVP